MNKTKLITLSLVLALVLMGTAFAWWTQSTTISNKITTGELQIELSKAKILGKEIEPRFYFGNSKSIIDHEIIKNDYKASVTKFDFPNTYTVNLEVQNMFPGSSVAYSFEVNNTGTVPVKISDVTLTGYGLPVDRLNEVPITLDFVVISKIGPLPIPKTTTVSGTYSNIAGKIVDALKSTIIYPEDVLVFGIIEQDVENGFRISIPEGWENNTENSTFGFSLNFEYTQANK